MISSGTEQTWSSVLRENSVLFMGLTHTNVLRAPGQAATCDASEEQLHERAICCRHGAGRVAAEECASRSSHGYVVCPVRDHRQTATPFASTSERSTWQVPRPADGPTRDRVGS